MAGPRMPATRFHAQFYVLPRLQLAAPHNKELNTMCWEQVLKQMMPRPDSGPHPVRLSDLFSAWARGIDTILNEKSMRVALFREIFVELVVGISSVQ